MPPPTAIGDTVGNSHTGASNNERVDRPSDPGLSKPMVRPNTLVVERTFHQGEERPVGETKALQHSQRQGLGLRRGEGTQKGTRGVRQLEPKDAEAGLDETVHTVKDGMSTLVIHASGGAINSGKGVDEGSGCEGSGDGFRSTTSRPSELFDSLDLSVS